MTKLPCRECGADGERVPWARVRQGNVYVQPSVYMTTEMHRINKKAEKFEMLSIVLEYPAGYRLCRECLADCLRDLATRFTMS